MSDTEAHAILGRAADLQAVTALRLQPLNVARRDVQRDATRQSGHRPEALRDAAVEAGIPAAYVDRAIDEHGLGTATAIQPLEDHSLSSNAFLGSPARLDFEIVVDGEMPVEDFDLLVEVIRQATGEGGQLTTVGRSFSWQSSPAKGNINVSVIPRVGKTRIRVSESLRVAATGIFGGLIGGIGGTAFPVCLGAALRFHDPLFGILMWGGTTLITYLGARGLFSMHNRSRTKHLRSIAERLAEQARESIDFAKPKLQPPNRSRLRG